MRIFFSVVVMLGALTLTNCGKETIIERIEVQKGNQILSGNGRPDVSVGSVGDYYLDMATTELYGAKTEQGWGTPINLKGLQGAKGDKGTDGVAGSDGTKILSGNMIPTNAQGSVGDFYIDLNDKKLYGPKSNNGWGSGISLSGGTVSISKADFLISDDHTTLLQWRNKNSTAIDLTTISELTNVTKIGNRAFFGCVDLTSVKIPENITYIGHYAFEDCHQLLEIRIPKQVTTLGNYVFERCGKLTNVYIETVNPPNFIVYSIGGSERADLGYYTHNIENIYVPAGSLTAYQNHPQWKKLSEIKEYDSNIGEYVVKGSKLKPMP